MTRSSSPAGARSHSPAISPRWSRRCKANLPERCVVDGEVVIATDNNLDFEALLQRIHPAASRVNMLAEETPASFVAFDLLAIDDESLLGRPFARATGAADDAARRRPAAGLRHAGHRQRRAGAGVVRGLRRRGPRRGHRQTAQRHLPVRRTRDAQDQARADGRLRRRRLPLAQVRRRRRVTPARHVRRRRVLSSTSECRPRSR